MLTGAVGLGTMSRIESAIQDLVVSLEELSARAERQLLDAADRKEELAATQRRARAAQAQANSVALDLASIITEMRSLVDQIEPSDIRNNAPIENAPIEKD